MPHILFLIFILCANAHAEIRETKRMAEVVRSADKDTLLIFDIDNTLIEPLNQLGSDQWYYFLSRKYNEVDGLKENEAYEKATKVWNQAQDLVKVRSVEAKTPELVREAQQKKIKTLALTARSYSVAERTLAQLDSVGIDFRKNGLSDKDLEIQNQDTANFTRGILFVGEHNDKGKVLVQFLKELHFKPKRIVFVDDKIKNIKNVDAALTEQKMKSLAFRYGAADEKVKAFKDDSENLKLFFFGEMPEKKLSAAP